MNNVRNSNHEIMRILSMFFIVLWHVILYGGVLTTTNENVKVLCRLMQFIIVVHVNSFVLVSGYYQSNSKFKQSKVWQIINSSWFYRVIIMAIFLITGIEKISNVQIIKDILPVTVDNYWFIKMYLLLYCLSPFLNKLIDSLDKKSFQKLLLVNFIILSIIPNITNGEFIFNNGYTLYNFIYLYLIGAYLRLYPLEKSYFFKIFSTNLFRIIMIIIFIFCVIIDNAIFYQGKQLSGINGVFDILSNTIEVNILNYSNPIVIIQSIAYFSFFTTLTIKSKVINKFSGLMLGVYFIHENDHLRSQLYTWLDILNIPKNSALILVEVIIMAVIIFVGCSIVEFTRQQLFHLISKNKLFQKIRNNYYNWVKTIHIVNS